MRNLQAGLQQIQSQIIPPLADKADALKTALSLVIEEKFVTAALEIVSKHQFTPEEFVKATDFVTEHFSSFLNSSEAIVKLFNSNETVDEKQEYLLKQIAFHESKGFVFQSLSTVLQLPTSTLSLLLEKIITSYADQSQKTLFDYLRLVDIVETIPNKLKDRLLLTSLPSILITIRTLTG